MNKEITLMMEQFGQLSITDSKNALKEIIQELSLLALAGTDFFAQAAFYGGSALRIFHGLDRFSEDMDFSLKSPDPDFTLQPYLDAIETLLNSYDFEMKTEIKKKSAQ
jgi:predicted nucleotidyltransferase component of viral defense system